MVDTWLKFSRQGLIKPWVHPMIISPVPECIIEIDVFDDWTNPHTWILGYRINAIAVWEAKLKSVKLYFYPGQDSKSKIILLNREVSSNCDPTKD